MTEHLTTAKMGEEMYMLHNVMPVELAIRREMEYRSKMELLKNQPLSNLKSLLPSQVHPPTQVRSKRKERPRNFQGFPTLQPSSSHQPSTSLSCKICEMTFPNILHLKQHSETSRHKGNTSLMKKTGLNVSTPFVCELCNISCSSGLVMENHLNGTKHTTALQQFENAERAPVG